MRVENLMSPVDIGIFGNEINKSPLSARIKTKIIIIMFLSVLKLTYYSFVTFISNMHLSLASYSPRTLLGTPIIHNAPYISPLVNFNMKIFIRYTNVNAFPSSGTRDVHFIHLKFSSISRYTPVLFVLSLSIFLSKRCCQKTLHMNLMISSYSLCHICSVATIYIMRAPTE